MQEAAVMALVLEDWGAAQLVPVLPDFLPLQVLPILAEAVQVPEEQHLDPVALEDLV
jgi:hypothetical protein